jgi:opacity protein-like surface antigen
MKRLLTVALTLVTTHISAPVFAQSFEAAALVGYTTPAGLEHDARTVEDLKLAGSFTWGASLDFFLSPRLALEGSWARVGTGVVLSTAEASQEMVDVTIDHVHGSVVYQRGDADSRLRPFLMAGAGAALFSATDLDRETKLSFNLGAGLKWHPWNRIGARVQGRYLPTYLNDQDSDFCDPFGFCQSWLHQFELSGGVIFRF